MAFFNYATKEITLKVVYYGPGLSGKTTNLQYLYSALDASSRGKFISLSTEADRTLFFDFLPVDLGKIRDFTIRFQLYTVPGQIRYNATRKLVLKGADAVIFVADSQREMKEQNIESLENMKENLLSNNIAPDSILVFMQYNKRDLPNVLTVEELNRDLNKGGYQYLEAEAINGKGVQDTFRMVTKALLSDISRKHKVDIAPAREEGISIRVREKDVFDMSEEVPLQSVEEPAEIAELPEFEELLETEDRAERMITAARPPETVTAVPERAETVMVTPGPVETVITAPQPEAPAAPHFSEEKLNQVINSLEEIARSLSQIRETVSSLSNETTESKKWQSEMVDALTDVKIGLAKIKQKKRRFFF